MNTAATTIRVSSWATPARKWNSMKSASGSVCSLFWQRFFQHDRAHEIEHDHVGCGLGPVGGDPAKISKIEYDFWGWAIQRWGRAVKKMDSVEFPVWLKDVQS